MKKRQQAQSKRRREVRFIKLCTLGVAAIFAITVLVVVISANFA